MSSQWQGLTVSKVLCTQVSACRRNVDVVQCRMETFAKGLFGQFLNCLKWERLSWDSQKVISGRYRHWFFLFGMIRFLLREGDTIYRDVNTKLALPPVLVGWACQGLSCLIMKKTQTKPKPIFCFSSFSFLLFDAVMVSVTFIIHQLRQPEPPTVAVMHKCIMKISCFVAVSLTQQNVSTSM